MVVEVEHSEGELILKAPLTTYKAEEAERVAAVGSRGQVEGEWRANSPRGILALLQECKDTRVR